MRDLFKDNLFLQGIERYIMHLIYVNLYRVAIILFIIIFFVLVVQIPYLNLLITRDVSIVLTLFIILYILNIRTRTLFLAGLIFLVFAMASTLIVEYKQAEFFANVAYAIFFLGLFTFLTREK